MVSGTRSSWREILGKEAEVFFEVGLVPGHREELEEAGVASSSNQSVSVSGMMASSSAGKVAVAARRSPRRRRGRR